MTTDTLRSTDPTWNEFGAVCESLYRMTIIAVPDWVRQCVVEVYVDASRASGVEPSLDLVGSVSIIRAAERAGWEASAEVGRRLRELFDTPIGDQRTSPLEIVGDAVSYPTAVLKAAGVPPVARAPEAVRLLPRDLYGLTPKSLGTLHPMLPELVVRWKELRGAVRAGRAPERGVA